ncbi:MAG: ABC transporter ATP-binding protein [Rhodomicrobium sp.]
MSLQVSGLDSWYGKAQILSGVSLCAEIGEAVVVLGRNGAGKSTLFRSLLRLIPKVIGRVTFNGRDISALPTYEIVRVGLGYVPEDRRIFTELTIEENLAAGLQPPRAGAPLWKPDALYALFPNLAHARKRLAGRLSGGEQQMLTIARTLMGNPSLVLLDEPSEGLAPKIVEDMAAAILAMKRQGLGILLAEQNLHFSRAIADRAYIIEKGTIRFEGTLAELDAKPEAVGAYLAL